MPGTLFLLPNTLALRASETTSLDAVLPEQVRRTAARLDYFIGENAKTTRAFLKLVGIERPIQTIEIRELNVDTRPAELAEFIAPIEAGRDGGLVSEAGCPAIADPGADLVALAHSRGIVVRPMVGPSSILLALMASGLNGQSFAFNGYLPTDAVARSQRIREFEERSRRERQTQIFIETPYRNTQLLDALIATLTPRTQLVVATDLSLSTEQIAARSVAQWRAGQAASVSLAKRPSVFLFLA